MSIADDIAAIRARLDLSEDEQRPLIYALKVKALLKAIKTGKVVKCDGWSFRINEARATDQPALWLDVTFLRPPSMSVTHQITIVNPPVLTRERKEDLKTVIAEMLEGFV